MRTKYFDKLSLAILLASAAFLAGCVSTWSYPEGPVTSYDKRYSITFPKGWTYIGSNQNNDFVSTYDGVNLQAIFVESHSLKAELPFAKESVRSDMNAEELVNIYYEDVYKNPEYKGVEMELAGPAKLGGVDGFELVFSYTVSSGLRYRQRVTGAIKSGSLVTVAFRAPTRHYYDRDDDLLPAVLESFRFN